MAEGMAAASVRLTDVDATLACGSAIAADLAPGDVACLYGGLGAGKTTLARGIIRALTGVDTVTSPTYTLVHGYTGLNGAAVLHADLYRLDDPQQIEELGFDETLGAGIIVVEWPERWGDRLPADRLNLALDMGDAPDARVLRISGHGQWEGRAHGLSARLSAAFGSAAGGGDAGASGSSRMG